MNTTNNFRYGAAAGNCRELTWLLPESAIRATLADARASDLRASLSWRNEAQKHENRPERAALCPA
jgi:hypothetical protein